jgi:hypothetical protein
LDQIVDETTGCALLSFLDCYLGYDQIAHKEEDPPKISFITPFGAYCYTAMSFGLKNASTTYQRAIQDCLSSQIGQYTEAYVDDVVTKTRSSDTLIEVLTETFANLWKFRWKLNPTKCTFSVPSEELLRFIISHHGIEASLEQIMVITWMGPPQSIKDV